MGVRAAGSPGEMANELGLRGKDSGSTTRCLKRGQLRLRFTAWDVVCGWYRNSEATLADSCFPGFCSPALLDEK